MELDWSEQSPHIRTLYHPWQPGDGYKETIIQAAEIQLGCRLPATLRNFYATWGRHKDLTSRNQSLVGPDQLVVRSDALIFCFENQAVYSWAIRHEDLDKANPPVVGAYSLPDWEWGDVDAPLIWMPSYTHVSDFLDTLTYHHAFCGGAIHGGYTNSLRQQEFQQAWLEQQWQCRTVGPMVFGLVDEFSGAFPPLYIRNGQALTWSIGCSVAVRDIAALDEISQALQVTWAKQW
ncbi:hypothetical protein KDA_40250 [Dictyobacter alpinus]|uniref:Knr4/Smi1-like domain-containing protein n=1 Tax=Dictyobacter alpinus TaxID=2014873 RepID=A0A402BAU1_9CHLR|nr:SMI1/KNR4 family protein [Dictyobacter alpinus]GCE28541.1 hypothetical protein KDA_40250 [Dictyobacter alpinus]